MSTIVLVIVVKSLGTLVIVLILVALTYGQVVA